MRAVAAVALLGAAVPAVAVPNFTLANTGAGVVMPAIGLGTGGYGSNPAVGYNGYPECWQDSAGCGAFAKKAVSQWLALGGRRIDSANSYANLASVGAAMAESGVARGDIFLLTKVGPGFPLGYQDAMDQWAAIQSTMNITYADLLLIHWPTDDGIKGNSTDPACNAGSGQYDPRACRISTWKALVAIWQAGGARAIGVSNYNSTHLQEIVDAGLPLPAVNQCPFNLYRSTTQEDTIQFCKAHGILFHGYSPLGALDFHSFPAGTPGLAASQLSDPNVVRIAKRHGVTPAQVLLNWQWQLGVPTNPRTMNATHMADNLKAFDFVLGSAEVATLSAAAQDTCAVDPTWYECAP